MWRSSSEAEDRQPGMVQDLGDDLLNGGHDRPLGAAAAGRSGRADVSERIEEILAREVPSSH